MLSTKQNCRTSKLVFRFWFSSFHYIKNRLKKNSSSCAKNDSWFLLHSAFYYRIFRLANLFPINGKINPIVRNILDFSGFFCYCSSFWFLVVTFIISVSCFFYHNIFFHYNEDLLTFLSKIIHIAMRNMFLCQNKILEL